MTGSHSNNDNKAKKNIISGDSRVWLSKVGKRLPIIFPFLIFYTTLFTLWFIVSSLGRKT